MEGTLRKRISELERRSAEIDGLLEKTENEQFAWTTLCDIRKRVVLCGQRCNHEFPELASRGETASRKAFFAEKTAATSGDENGYIELESMITAAEHDIKDIYRIVARAQREVYQKIRDKCGLSEMSIKVRRENAKVQEKNSIKKQQYEQAKKQLAQKEKEQTIEQQRRRQKSPEVVTTTPSVSSSRNWETLGSTNKWETQVPKEWENKIKPFWDNNNPPSPSTPPKVKTVSPTKPRSGLNVGATSYPMIMTPQPQSPSTTHHMPLQMLYPVNQLPPMAYIANEHQLNHQLLQQRFMLGSQQSQTQQQQHAAVRLQQQVDLLQKQQLSRYFGGQL